jgi:hypothetical protein
MAAEVNRKLVSTSGAFGSTLERFHGKGAASPAAAGGTSPAPGPGSYEQQAASPNRGAAVYASTTERFRQDAAPPAVPDHIRPAQISNEPWGDYAKLGPGAYDLPVSGSSCSGHPASSVACCSKQ